MIISPPLGAGDHLAAIVIGFCEDLFILFYFFHLEPKIIQSVSPVGNAVLKLPLLSSIQALHWLSGVTKKGRESFQWSR